MNVAAKILQSLVFIFWALWFGGMIALVLFVIRLFNTSRDLGIHAAPVLFRTFSMYQLMVGMIACAAGTLLSMKTRNKLCAAATFILICALADAVIIGYWTNQMLRILAAGESSGAAFQLLHQKTNAAYSIAAMLLFVAGIVWAFTLSALPARRAAETAAA